MPHLTRDLVLSVLLSLAALPLVSAQPASPPSKPAQAAGGAGAAVFMPAAELKWTDVAEFPGLKMAVVQGNPAKGAAHFFLKLPAGFSAPVHFHNADHWVAVVTGTLMLTPEGGKETSLPAGSGFGFTGKKRHATKCAEGGDCVLFLDTRGKWDVVPVEKKK